MKTDDKIKFLKSELQDELEKQLLPFWLKHSIDEINGGFVGRIDHELKADNAAPKAAVMNTRILWSFAQAYNITGKKVYLDAAHRAFNFIFDHFLDKDFGGIFWEINAQGKPTNNRKQAYAQAFTIYGLAEYFLASNNQEALEMAIDLFHDIESQFYDKTANGYIEALSNDWQVMDDMRLSEKDLNSPFSMNTHLHILEAYTKLYLVWKDLFLEKQLGNILEIHLYNIVDHDTSHLKLFFEKDWTSLSDVISYGHDIEAAWLMHEAAKALNSKGLIQYVSTLVVSIAQLTLNEGIQADGSLVYEGNNEGITDTDRHWWPQFEAMVGFMDAYEITGDDKFLDIVVNLWQFIKKHMRHTSGEYWWRVNENYSPNQEDDLIGPWKGPYHNTRGLIEVIHRIKELQHKI